MPLWRDPLDELINGLDETLPPVATPAEPNWSSLLFGCQMIVGAILRKNPQHIERVKQDPHVKAYLAHLQRLKAPPPDDPTADLSEFSSGTNR